MTLVKSLYGGEPDVICMTHSDKSNKSEEGNNSKPFYICKAVSQVKSMCESNTCTGVATLRFLINIYSYSTCSVGN